MEGVYDRLQEDGMSDEINKKLDMILKRLDALEGMPAGSPMLDGAEAAAIKSQVRADCIRSTLHLMKMLAKGPGHTIEQIRALRALNSGMGQSGFYIGLREAKELVDAVNRAAKLEN